MSSPRLPPCNKLRYSFFVNVIILTVFIGLMLVAFFIGFFLYLNAHRGSLERDALMPLQEEIPRPACRGTALKTRQ